jgi:hypothetical protein
MTGEVESLNGGLADGTGRGSVWGYGSATVLQPA